jgi:hypothetical protein
MDRAGECPCGRPDYPSASDGRITDRYAIVEGHEEGIGVPVKDKYWSAMIYGVRTRRRYDSDLQLPNY